MKTKAIGYIRVSREIQVEDGSSLDSQKQYLANYCSFNNIELTEIISDEGISAFKSKVKRPGFQKVIDMVKNRQTQGVVVYSISRFARNTSQLLGSVELMKENGVQFHSVKEKLDTSSAIGVFFLTIVGAIAQLESGQTSERIRDVKKHNKSIGKTYSSPVFGFKNDTQQHALVPIESEIQTVKSINSMRINGLSYNKIAQQLNSQGVRSKKDGLFYSTTIKNICENEVYKQFASA